MPPPTSFDVAKIREILAIHNVMEEGDGGLYEIMESLAGDDLASLLARVHAIPEVPVAPHTDTPVVRRSIDQL
ncbi:MAG TPA: hemerythrin domain-containing protein, partial [Thermoanaerobaculia bacterium]|nr:hemerythrin domain-containing protein [Thermoanaerobaculia bacterium]